MEKISLYIADKKVDLDDKSLILFNYTMEDLSNPTAVKNSFSKQVTLKGTPANNAIFGHLFKSDRKTMYGVSHSGVFFDPMRKTPFAIYSERGDVLESGYVKVDSMTNTNGKIEYKVTLYGGLGSFLYGLTYDEDGNKRTLASLKKWRHHNGDEKGISPYAIDAETIINDAWRYLERGSSSMGDGEAWDIINFAPCYNGIPADFDANKVLYSYSGFAPFDVTTFIENGVTYAPKSGCRAVLATMANKHTEWEMRVLMAYLQRPVVRMKAIIDAIMIEAREQGYSVFLDYNFFEDNPTMYERTWVTMPLLKKEDRHSQNIPDAVMRMSLTPADYLLSFLKTFGLILIVEGKKISIVTRRYFYGITGNEDLTDRIDTSSIQIYPLIADHKWYQMKGSKIVGNEAKSYEERYGLPYGGQRINTGYEFDNEVEEITKGISFIGAADVAETSYCFAAYHDITYDANGAIIGVSNYHPICLYEEVKRQLFSTTDGTSKDFTFPMQYISPILWNTSAPYSDWLPKVQMHGDDNKAEQGEHCMLFFVGMKESPKNTYAPGMVSQPGYWVADDHPDIGVLNSGVSCWNLAGDKTAFVNNLPSFRRRYGNYSLDWGKPLETFTAEDTENLIPIYDRYWKSYLTDRYNTDTKRMVCKVNLTGLKVDKNLMKKRFYYDGALWVLNKINNYSLTTDGLTECEFIKVNNWDNFKSQTL